jgi:sugar/nucleoside kinase (ribokinase family)
MMRCHNCQENILLLRLLPKFKNGSQVCCNQKEKSTIVSYEHVFCPAPLEEVFDPTGAGDIFAGGFAGFITQSEKIHLKI